MAISPVIENGDLKLTHNGNLKSDNDIVTQLTVILSAYNWITNLSINSQLLQYISEIPIGGFQSNTVMNIIKSAYTILIREKVIENNLGILVNTPTIGQLSIKISVIDASGNNVQIKWKNLELQE